MRAFLIFGLVAVGAFTACSSKDDAKLPPGRCMVSGDCPEGHTCRNTYCEDIYHPRKDIKIN